MPNSDSPSSALERDTARRLCRRLLPVLVLGYLVAYIDRSAVSIAALTMNESIGLTAAQFGLGAGLFYLTYIALEIPSNIVLAKVGARVWLARIMITWGLVTLAMAAIEGPTSFYVTRLLLGAAEAGFTPGVLWYITRWFPKRIRITALTIYGAGTALAPLIGAPLGGLLLQLDGVLGLEGWRWIFIVEAIPAFIVAIVFFTCLTNEPGQARWLPDRNRAWLVERLAVESRAIATRFPGHIRSAFTNPGVLLVGAVFFLFSANATGLTLWMPQVIKGTFGQPSNGQVAVLSAIPSLVAIVGLLLTAWSVRRFGRADWHLSGILVVAGVLLVASVLAGATPAGFVLLCVASGGAFSVGALIWQVAGRFATGVAAAAALALINSLGNLAGFALPLAIGAAKDATGSFQVPVFIVAGALVAGGIVATFLRRIPDPDPIPEQVRTKR